MKNFAIFVVILLLVDIITFSDLIAQNQKSNLSADSFKHHYIVKSPQEIKQTHWGYGVPNLADLDRDGDLDFTFGVRSDSVYWFEFKNWGDWKRHTVGPLKLRTLGGTSEDVDNDGWVDIIAGRYWYRNTGKPKSEEFEVFQYDSTIHYDFHDIETADINGDGSQNVITLGDEEGIFWYQIADNSEKTWTKHLITDKVLVNKDAIHSGFSPNGIGDLDQDGDADIVLPDRWLENRNSGTKWIPHSLPAGNRGPWGLSTRSWITDLNNDNQPDIVATDSDQTDSGIYWLENKGGDNPHFEFHPLPMHANGTRGSFHALAVADFDLDGDKDIFTVEQEDTQIFPEGATPRWFIWENSGGKIPEFTQHIILDQKLGGHDAEIGDVDQDGDPDICAKIWKIWSDNAAGGYFHADCLENKTIE